MSNNVTEVSIEIQLKIITIKSQWANVYKSVFRLVSYIVHSIET